MQNIYQFAYQINGEKAGIVTAAASLIASIVAGTACIGPLLGIAIGVSSLGWLAQFSYLTLPASITSVLLLAVAIYIYQTRKSSCVSRKKHFLNQCFLGLTATAVVGINVFEYVILPTLS